MVRFLIERMADAIRQKELADPALLGLPASQRPADILLVHQLLDVEFRNRWSCTKELEGLVVQ